MLDDLMKEGIDLIAKANVALAESEWNKERKKEREELRILRGIIKQLGYKYWKTDEGWRWAKDA